MTLTRRALLSTAAVGDAGKPPKEDMSLAVVAARYDAERNRLLAAIRAGNISASLSGIEYMPKPWAELDATNESDAEIIRIHLGMQP